eukprot:scaffold69727_cov21-Tisochrysis_lutea.AAC.2
MNQQGQPPGCWVSAPRGRGDRQVKAGCYRQAQHPRCIQASGVQPRDLAAGPHLLLCVCRASGKYVCKQI